MTVKVQMVNGGSDSVDFVNAAGTTLAQVKGYDDGSSNGHLELYTTASGTSTEQVRITSAGNVGIGTSSPVVKLDVVGSSARTRWNLSNAYSYQVVTNPSDSVYLDSQVDALSHIWKTSSTERMRIDSSGNLLVGTTGTSAAAGSIQLMPASNGAGNPVLQLNHSLTSGGSGFAQYSTGASAYRFYVNYGGTINATSTTITGISDQRLKENIRDLDDGLDVVLALKPRKFDWKEGKGADIKNARGFIAQEFEQVLPDMIEEWLDPAPEGEEPYKAVNANLIPTLVKAIQEQQAIIQTLTERITALENKQ